MIGLIKKVFKSLPIAFTKNQQYDKQTKSVLKKVCRLQSNCIDVGCHKGEILDIFIQYAPLGKHYGFEPIPTLFENLLKKYKGSTSNIYNIALSNAIGKATFNYVVSNPAYSGLIKRKYDNRNEIDQEIMVETNRLDTIIPLDLPIDVIKIDVEGGELLVLEGAMQTIKKYKPIIIFEHGKGASEFYDSTPEKVFNFFANCEMKISTMKNWLHQKPAFTLHEFQYQFNNKVNYYFIAHP
ncbi:MAG: FkbM family methyltransferase [Chitinophagaceae bacterium]